MADVSGSFAAGAVIVVGPKEGVGDNMIITLGAYYPSLAELTQELARVSVPGYPYYVYIWHKGGDPYEQAHAKARELTKRSRDGDQKQS